MSNPKASPPNKARLQRLPSILPSFQLKHEFQIRLLSITHPALAVDPIASLILHIPSSSQGSPSVWPKQPELSQP